MTKFASALKDEISNVARRAVRSETAALKKASTAYRHEIAALKKRIAAVERTAKRGVLAPARSHASEESAPAGLRFRAAGFAAHRQRLGLSAAEMGLLVGASMQSVYGWERGKVRPRAEQLEAIAAVRRMGKREALARLEALKEG